jgi:hypothetical protein
MPEDDRLPPLEAALAICIVTLVLWRLIFLAGAAIYHALT